MKKKKVAWNMKRLNQEGFPLLKVGKGWYLWSNFPDFSRIFLVSFLLTTLCFKYLTSLQYDSNMLKHFSNISLKSL